MPLAGPLPLVVIAQRPTVMATLLWMAQSRRAVAELESRLDHRTRAKTSLLARERVAFLALRTNELSSSMQALEMLR